MLTQEQSVEILEAFDKILAIGGQPPISETLKLFDAKMPAGAEKMWTTVTQDIATSISAAFTEMQNQMTALLQDENRLQELLSREGFSANTNTADSVGDRD
jgi:hypothetical protein